MATGRTSFAGGAVWEAFSDGASRGNPGPAAYGVVVVNPSGEVVKEVNAYLGTSTNSVAEYEGLIRAMEELNAVGARCARVRTDSELIVKQFSGEYRVRDERMKDLMSRVRLLEKEFDVLEILHVRRSSHPLNTRVDKLANEALNKAETLSPSQRPPPGLF